MLSPSSQPRHKRYSIRWQARLDSETHANLLELAQGLHRKQAQILRYVMLWGVDHPDAQTFFCPRPDRIHLVHMLVEPALSQRVQEAAALHGASWRAGETARRSHELGHYQTLLGKSADAALYVIVTFVLGDFRAAL